MKRRRNICFVTGTRAEFGLMRTVLRAIDRHPRLNLQLIVTGMHLDARLGKSIDAIRRDGWSIDATVPWESANGSPSATAAAMGSAVAGIARTLDRLGSDVVLVVGDRVEAFAAAAAGQVSQKTVAHVHGGDRAQGQVDDALRHAITKLAHVHFPATEESARRIRRLGEQPDCIHCVGAPGVDGLADAAATFASLRREFPGLRRRRYALLVLHPTDTDPDLENRRARTTLAATLDAGFERIVIVAPNNDPGADGILRAWEQMPTDLRVIVRPNVARSAFLGLMRDAAVLVGNSSSGIIEAASFGTPVVNIGPRQHGRERSANVIDVPHMSAAIRRALTRVWNGGRPRRWRGRNVYGGPGAGRRIADVLGRSSRSAALCRKLITY